MLCQRIPTAGLASCLLSLPLVFLLADQRVIGQDKAQERGPEIRSAKNAVAGLDIAPGLEATLFASEPQITSLTNIDIDAHGRVWACEVVNYRGNRGRRKAGDRILILEDTDGDGKSDRQKVFYQGTDVDSAMGICVLGNRIIVSCSPNVLVFTDIDGDDRPDRKEALFTKTGQPQHDHSAHSFLFGPDGKMYWNFGNTGRAVHDYKGDPVVDLAGRRVVDNGKPYFGGMPFRCDPDGSRFEVLAHNFRNNYEITVDSYGTLWQSDNDDDGNRGVRINFVMEGGNYGYRDELTGAGWRSARTGMHRDIPIRHWHQNDPGVIPNLLQTGAGSPTGITIYEGRLLPEVFHDQVIHCDAGPSVVRAYPAKVAGAGYEARIVDLVKGTRDNWFRPADVCVAPDGSVFVSDWYDPGVGGHRQQDLDRGRLFRIAPPGHNYRPPRVDTSTVEGAISALKNPAFSVRYLAFVALESGGAPARKALTRLAADRSSNPRHRARALWVLGKSASGAEAAGVVETAMMSEHPDLRIVGLRLARQTEYDVMEAVSRLSSDKIARVRRECLVALKTVSSDKVASVWADLASQYDGEDRWYLEALGLAADGRWDACLAAWRKRTPQAEKTPAGRDILWRSRARDSASRLADIISDATTPVADLPRYLRALDFQAQAPRQAAALALITRDHGRDAGRANLVIREAIRRVGNLDLSENEAARLAIARVANRQKGTAGFVGLVGRFNLEDHYPELVAMAQADPNSQTGVDAARMLLVKRQAGLLRTQLLGKDEVRATALARALANASDARSVSVLGPLVDNGRVPLAVRRESVRGVIRGNKEAANGVLNRLKAKTWPEDLRQAAGAALLTHADGNIRKQALVLFPPPPSKDKTPLPPIAELANRKGNAGRGFTLFAKAATCAKCHKVNGQGKEVGPDLSGIGRKLSRQALYESILFPSAGISHNYETHVVALADGTLVTGLLISRTPAVVTIRNNEGIDRTVKTGDIEEMKKQTVSLMPADLQKLMTARDLVDVVEYLVTLRRVQPKPPEPTTGKPRGSP